MATNMIIMNRGDSFDFDITVHDDNSPNGVYKLKGEDVLYFGLMDPHQPFECALIKKSYTSADYFDPDINDGFCDENGNLTISLEPEDTLCLIPGVYYYSVKLKAVGVDENGKAAERVMTVINRTKFIINE